MKKKTNSIKNGNKNVKVAGKSKAVTKQQSKPVTKQQPLPSTGWKKVKIAGRLMSDDGGAGLEGLLGVEVLENFDAPIKRQKFEKVGIPMFLPH